MKQLLLTLVLAFPALASTIYVPSGGYSSLSIAVSAAIASGGSIDTIVLEQDEVLASEISIVNYSHPLTILGDTSNPTSIDVTAPTAGRCFSIMNSGSVTISSIVFHGTTRQALNGLCALVYESDPMIVSDCTFLSFKTDTTMIYYGGAFLVLKTDLTLSESTFSECESSYQGGAVYAFDSDLTASDCQFGQCKSTTGGSVYSIDVEATTITDCGFSDCTAQNGGALCSKDSDLNVTGSVFQRCCSDSTGGAVAVNGRPTEDELVFQYCSFTWCTSDTAGAVFCRDYDLVTVEHCAFDSCSARRAGAVYSIDTDVSITQSEFTNCNGGREGGAICYYCRPDVHVLTVQNSDFINNRVDLVCPSWGGAIRAGFSADSVASDTTLFEVLISDSDFRSNGSCGFGGAVNLGLDASIDDCRFNGNSATRGGSLFLFPDAFVCVNDCSFDSCGVETSGSIPGGGGAIYNSEGILRIDDCSFFRNFASERGGALLQYDGSTRIGTSQFEANATREPFLVDSTLKQTFGGAVYQLAGSVSIYGSSFHDNYASNGGAIAAGDGKEHVVLDIDSCFMRENLAGAPTEISGYSRMYSGGAIFLYSTKTEISNSIIAENELVCSGGNSGRGGGVFRKRASGGTGTYSRSPLLLENCLISENTISGTTTGSRYGGGLMLLGSKLDLWQCTIANNGTANVEGAGLCISDSLAGNHARLDMRNTNCSGNATDIVCDLVDSDSVYVEYSNVYDSSLAWPTSLSSCSPAVVPSNRSLAPKLTTDLELRWDSPILDIGDPDSLDYDLTVSDIGWHKPLEIEVLSGGTYSASQLPRKVYEIDASTCVITCGSANQLVPGTVIRVGEDNSLKITAPHGTDITFGDLDGPRSALVGVQNGDNYGACTRIEFGDYINSLTTPLSEAQLTGVLFNYAPSDGVAFNHCEVDLEDPVVTFYEGTGTGLLELQFCLGDVASFDFAESQFARMYLYRSSVDVTDCSFPVVPSAAQWALSVYRNHPDRSYLSLEGLYFPGARPGLPEKKVVRIAKASVSITDCSLGAHLLQDSPMIFEEAAYLDMAMNARNTLNDQNNNIPELIEMNFGEVDLYCGYNVFIRTDPDHDFPIITSNTEVWSHQDTDWGLNYWGESCSQVISLAELVGDSLVPYWQDDPWSDWSSPQQLLSCSQPYIGCDWTYPTTKELISEARGALELGDAGEALDVASMLVLQFPNSAEAYEATNIVGSIGTNTETGAELYGEVVSALSNASVISEGYDHGLSIVQATEALLVEARHGDRASVVAQLEQEIQSSEDSFVVSTSEQALLEIETWPTQGGMATANPDIAAANEVRIRQAVVALRDYGRVPASKTSTEACTDEVLPLPGRITLLKAYPNPFNPVTTVQFEVSTRSMGSVVVFNVLGQELCSLYDGEFEQGLNAYAFDGSMLASGVYIITAQTEQDCQMSKVLLLK